MGTVWVQYDDLPELYAFFLKKNFEYFLCSIFENWFSITKEICYTATFSSDDVLDKMYSYMRGKNQIAD